MTREALGHLYGSSRTVFLSEPFKKKKEILNAIALLKCYEFAFGGMALFRAVPFP